LTGIDVSRVERLLAEINEALVVMNDLLGVGEEEFLSDAKSIYAIKYAVVKIVEAATIVGFHILESLYGLSAETYSDVFKWLGERGVVSNTVSRGFVRLVGLRNLIVHRYWDVDDLRVYREAKGNGLATVKRFIEE